MNEIYDILIICYYTLIAINLVCYAVAVAGGYRIFKYVLIYLITAASTEVFSKLISKDVILFLGEKTNAPFYFFFIVLQFIAFSLFYKNVLPKRRFSYLLNAFIIVILFITVLPYLIDYKLIMIFTPWAAFITLPILLLMSTVYFIDLLKNRYGYPFINIGIFLMIGCSLINFVTFPFQAGIEVHINKLKLLLHILPLLSLHILLLYECLLYFKSQIQPSTMSR